jgi:hypothetical protein
MTGRESRLIVSRALDGVLSGPFSSSRFISGTIGLVDVCDFRDERVIRVGVCKHRADREEDY